MAKLKIKTADRKSGGKTDAGRALERSPSHLLHRALQLALDIYADETGADALTQRQYAVLAAVAAHEGLTQTDLVHATGIDRSTLADLVARMIGKSLIARERSAADARANTVRLTATGRAALDATAPKVAAADARILKLLPARKRDLLLSVLHEMGHAAEPPAPSEVAVEKPKKKKKAKVKTAKAAKAPKPGKAEKTEPVTKTPKTIGAEGGKKKKLKKASALAESAA